MNECYSTTPRFHGAAICTRDICHASYGAVLWWFLNAAIVLCPWVGASSGDLFMLVYSIDCRRSFFEIKHLRDELLQVRAQALVSQFLAMTSYLWPIAAKRMLSFISLFSTRINNNCLFRVTPIVWLWQKCISLLLLYSLFYSANKPRCTRTS